MEQKLPEYIDYRYMEIYCDNGVEYIKYPTEISELIIKQIGLLENIARGKILTIIEACIQDKEQQKAVKDLIHSCLNELNSDIYDHFSRKSYVGGPDIELIIKNTTK